MTIQATVPSIFSNEAFLRAAFGDPDWRRVKIATFLGDPEKQPRDAWKGFPAEDMLRAAHAHLNTYFSVGVQEGSSRGLAGFEKICVVVLDDVGTKVDLDQAVLILGPPSYVIETSPGNHQAGWFTEIKSRDWALGLVRALYEALGRSADNLTNLVGYMRLPIGTNGKAKLGPGGWQVKMTAWNPRVRLETLDWVAVEGRLGKVVPIASRHQTRSQAMPDPLEIEADAIYRAFQHLGRVQGWGRPMTMGWGFDVICPWDQEHSERVHEGTSYVPVQGRFHCHHGHCQDRTTSDVRARLDELLREDSGGLMTLAGLEFDEVDPSTLPRPAVLLPTEKSSFAGYEPTEDGLTQAFVDLYRDRLRFDHAHGRWYYWTGNHWAPDGTQRAFDWVTDMLREFRRGMHDVTQAQLRAWGKVAVAGAIERAARANKFLATDGSSWDQDRLRAGTPGGEVDLVTGNCERPDPKHQITKQLLVAPSDMATPVWDAFMWDSTGGNTELISFLEAWAGYCLTGDVSEEKFLFIYGPGGNGKGTFLYTMSAILHEYATRAPSDMFMVRKHEAHPEEIARLHGVRAVIVAEIEGGRTFNVARLKDFTGRDGKLTGRYMRENTFEFEVQFKPTLVANNQPRLTEVDAAICRRLMLAPFTETPTTADPTLKDRLVAEYPGILRKMILGEIRRRTTPGGLAALMPAVMIAATNAYLEDQDSMRAWAAERCVFGLTNQVLASAAYDDYTNWCSSQGDVIIVTYRIFTGKFVEKFPLCTKYPTNKGLTLKGVSLTQVVVP